MSTFSRQGLRTVLVLAIAVGLGAYLLSLRGPFLFDDLPNITQNALLQIDGTVLDDWRAAALSSNAGPLRRPVSMLTFAADHAIAGGFNPAAMKAVNLAIHCLIGLLVYVWCLALLATPALRAQVPEQRRRGVALLAAALWLLHPLQVSTVLYVVQRMAQLSTLCVLGGLVLFTRCRLRWAQRGASAGDVAAAGLWLVLLTVLGGLSKENGLLLPWLVLAVEVALFQGVWAGGPRPRLVIGAWLLLLAPLVAAAAVLAISPESLIGGYANREFSLQARVLTQARMLWTYLGWTVWPDITAMGFQHDDIPLSSGLLGPATTLLSVLAWAATLVFAWAGRHRMPLLLFVVLFYLIGHSMESGVIPLEMVYEHRNYLPGTGICVGLAIALWRFAARFPQLNFPAVAGGAALVLSVLLATRAAMWSDEESLFRFNVVNHPDSPRANFFYAQALLNSSQAMQRTGEDPEDAKARMVAARHYLTEMYRLDPRDVAAPALLYQIDLVHFPGMPERRDWLAVLENLLADRRLQASDLGGLKSLVNFAGSGSPAADRQRILGLFDALIARYPRRIELQVQRYLLAKTAERFTPAEGLALLHEAQTANPRHRELYGYQIEANRALGDEAAAFQAGRDWLNADPQRRQLPALRRAF